MINVEHGALICCHAKVEFFYLKLLQTPPLLYHTVRRTHSDLLDRRASFGETSCI